MGSEMCIRDREDSNTIYSLLQIPMADMSDRNEVVILSPSNILHADLGIALVNKRSRCYRLLSNSDYLRCIETARTKVCQKRHIEIDFDPECDPIECKDWANVVVHDLTNTELIIVQANETTATLECVGEQPTSVVIPNSAIIKLSTDCSLHNKRFNIDRISFAKFEWDTQMTVKFSIEVERSPVSQDQINRISNYSAMQIDLANELNNLTLTQLEEFSSESEKRWKNVQESRTGLEQIMIWTLLALNLSLTLLLAMCVVRNTCRQNSVKPNQNIRISSGLEEGSLEPLWKEMWDLKGRLMGIEDEFLLVRAAVNPCKEVINITDVTDGDAENSN